MERIALLNWSTKNKDSDLTALWVSLLNGWAYDGLALSYISGTTYQVTAWHALILCTKTNGQKVLLHYENTATYQIVQSGNFKVWVVVDQDNLDNPALNIADGSWAGGIARGASYPAGNYIPLWSVVATVVTDEREITMKWVKRKGLWAWKVLVTNASWQEVELAFDTTTKVLTSNGVSTLPSFQSPTVDIVALTADATPDVTADYALTYDASASQNKKVLLENLPVGISNRTEDTSPAVWDFFLEWDVSASALKKVSLANLINNGYVMDIVNITKSTADASWSVAISHNLGRLPKMVFVYMIPQDYWSYDINSWGRWTPSEQSWIYKWYNSSAVKSGNMSHYVLRCELHPTSSVMRYDWSLWSPTTTQMTMTWTKWGTPSTVTMEVLLLFVW